MVCRESDTQIKVHIKHRKSLQLKYLRTYLMASRSGLLKEMMTERQLSPSVPHPVTVGLRLSRPGWGSRPGVAKRISPPHTTSSQSTSWTPTPASRGTGPQCPRERLFSKREKKIVLKITRSVPLCQHLVLHHLDLPNLHRAVNLIEKSQEYYSLINV